MCYSDMNWSKYPEFDPRLGCQEATQNGMYVQICICKGGKIIRQAYDFMVFPKAIVAVSHLTKDVILHKRQAQTQSGYIVPRGAAINNLFIDESRIPGVFNCRNHLLPVLK